MALQITLVKTPGKVSVSRTTHTFNAQGGTLGRGDSNTWVLPDPDKFLSSCHCEILVDGERYYLLDLSTNGTFLNGSPEPLGKGTRAPLGDGDFFELGDYRFSAKVNFDQSHSTSSPFGVAHDSTNASSLDDIFGAPQSSDSAFADPFSSPSGLTSDISLSPDIENTDPLLALDRAGQIPDAGISSTQGLFDQTPSSLDDELFSGGSGIDYSPSMDQSMSWPDSNQENLIPDDWEDDLLGHGSPSASPFAAPEKPVVPVVAPRPTQNPVARQVPPVKAAEPAPRVPPLAERIAQFDAQPQPENLPQSQPAPTPVIPSVASSPVIPPAVQQPVAAPVKPAATGVHVADSRLIAAMGLEAEKLNEEQINQISDMAGELMREIVEGMMQVLRSRTSIKNEFRMNVTTIQPVENNPLKFSVGVDEALENMFIKKSNAYKKPIEAFREGFQEIGEHQLAMIAGIRHGFGRMMERFNPETLEKNFTKQGKGGVIPGMQKAKYWSSYGDYYKGLEDNMESSFQHLFGSDFVHAYEDQLRKLSASRKKNK
jgi:type VI secretion system FHA domain protein